DSGLLVIRRSFSVLYLEAEELDLLPPEFALLLVESQVGVANSVQHLPQVAHVVVFDLREDQDVVEVDDHKRQVSENPLHQSLKRLWRVACSKRHPLEVVQPAIECKRRLLAILLPKHDLII